MRLILLIIISTSLFLCCGLNNNIKNNVTWQYLQGAWKFADSGLTYISYFDRDSNNPANYNGYLSFFKYPDSTDSGSLYDKPPTLISLNNDAPNKFRIDGSGFYEDEYVPVNVLNDSEMIITYPIGAELFSGNIHYYRAKNIVLHKDSMSYYITR